VKQEQVAEVAEVAEVTQKSIFSYTKEINNNNIEKPATNATGNYYILPNELDCLLLWNIKEWH